MSLLNYHLISFHFQSLGSSQIFFFFLSHSVRRLLPNKLIKQQLRNLFMLLLQNTSFALLEV